ncbi:MAG: hypothetical protein ACYS21_02160 [Planctomycetota bacterium]|jgi:hypothetical protein
MVINSSGTISRRSFFEKSAVAAGAIWSFVTDGALMLQVDLALPKWNSTEPMLETATPGWTIWADPRWADMYSHDGAKLENVGGTPIISGRRLSSSHWRLFSWASGSRMPDSWPV